MQELKVDKKELEKRVKYVVSLSKEIPWYVRKYKELGIDPDEIRSPQDLLKAYEKGLYTTPQDLPELVYYKHPEAKGPFYTSGTIGKPKEIWMNPDDEKLLVPKFLKPLEIIAEKKRILSCLPREPAISGYIMNQVLSSLGYQFVHGPAQEVGTDIKKFLEYYQKIQPTFLIGLTTFVYRLPLRLEELGVESKNLGIKSIVVGAEPSTIEKRKSIGEEFDALVYDWYVASETYGMIAFEKKPYSDEFLILYPSSTSNNSQNVLLFLTKGQESVSINEIGDVILTNLYPHKSQPYMVLINYKIGDHAKCLEEVEGIVTSIGMIRRGSTRSRLHPEEVEAAIERLEEYKKKLTGEYIVVDFQNIPREAVNKLIQQGIELDEEILERLKKDSNMYRNWDRKIESEIRIESRHKLQPEEKGEISKKIREILYSSNVPLRSLIEEIEEAKLFIEVEDPGNLYRGFRKLIKPAGKPKRLIIV
jgi:phenylacetate-coenzyme A ligase PaaK-like adenylate-forming protein